MAELTGSMPKMALDDRQRRRQNDYHEKPTSKLTDEKQFVVNRIFCKSLGNKKDDKREDARTKNAKKQTTISIANILSIGLKGRNQNSGHAGISTKAKAYESLTLYPGYENISQTKQNETVNIYEPASKPKGEIYESMTLYTGYSFTNENGQKVSQEVNGYTKIVESKPINFHSKNKHGQTILGTDCGKRTKRPTLIVQPYVADEPAIVQNDNPIQHQRSNKPASWMYTPQTQPISTKKTTEIKTKKYGPGQNNDFTQLIQGNIPESRMFEPQTQYTNPKKKAEIRTKKHKSGQNNDLTQLIQGNVPPSRMSEPQTQCTSPKKKAKTRSKRHRHGHGQKDDLSQHQHDNISASAMTVTKTQPTSTKKKDKKKAAKQKHELPDNFPNREEQLPVETTQLQSSKKKRKRIQKTEQDLTSALLAESASVSQLVEKGNLKPFGKCLSALELLEQVEYSDSNILDSLTENETTKPKNNKHHHHKKSKHDKKVPKTNDDEFMETSDMEYKSAKNIKTGSKTKKKPKSLPFTMTTQDFSDDSEFGFSDEDEIIVKDVKRVKKETIPLEPCTVTTNHSALSDGFNQTGFSGFGNSVSNNNNNWQNNFAGSASVFNQTGFSGFGNYVNNTNNNSNNWQTGSFAGSTSGLNQTGFGQIEPSGSANRFNQTGSSGFGSSANKFNSPGQPGFSRTVNRWETEFKNFRGTQIHQTGNTTDSTDENYTDYSSRKPGTVLNREASERLTKLLINKKESYREELNAYNLKHFNTNLNDLTTKLGNLFGDESDTEVKKSTKKRRRAKKLVALVKPESQTKQKDRRDGSTASSKCANSEPSTTDSMDEGGQTENTDSSSKHRRSKSHHKDKKKHHRRHKKGDKKSDQEGQERKEKKSKSKKKKKKRQSSADEEADDEDGGGDSSTTDSNQQKSETGKKDYYFTYYKCNPEDMHYYPRTTPEQLQEQLQNSSDDEMEDDNNDNAPSSGATGNKRQALMRVFGGFNKRN